MSQVACFQINTQIIHGSGSSESIAAVVDRFGAQRILLVTGPTLAKQGLAARVADRLDGSNRKVTIFSDVEPEPSSDTIKKGPSLQSIQIRS
jgi:alcohol dehydrogenase class IV